MDRLRYLTPRQVAAMLGVSVRTLEAWRANGTGPRFARLSKQTVRYEEAVVVAWARGRGIDPKVAP